MDEFGNTIACPLALHLDGTKIDFQDGPMGRGFTIDNRNVAKAGGCGSCGCH